MTNPKCTGSVCGKSQSRSAASHFRFCLFCAWLRAGFVLVSLRSLAVIPRLGTCKPLADKHEDGLIPLDVLGPAPTGSRNGAADCQSDTQSPWQRQDLHSALPGRHLLLGLLLLLAQTQNCDTTHSKLHQLPLDTPGISLGTTLAPLPLHAAHAGKKPNFTSSEAPREKCKSQNVLYFPAGFFKYVLFTIYSPSDGNSSGTPQAVVPTAMSLLGSCQVTW